MYVRQEILSRSTITIVPIQLWCHTWRCIHKEWVASIASLFGPFYTREEWISKAITCTTVFVNTHPDKIFDCIQNSISKHCASIQWGPRYVSNSRIILVTHEALGTWEQCVESCDKARWFGRIHYTDSYGAGDRATMSATLMGSFQSTLIQYISSVVTPYSAGQ